MAGDDRLTRITLRLTGDFRQRLGIQRTRFAFRGDTLRQLMAALVRDFDLGDLLMAGDEPRPYVQVVIDGRFSYLVGGSEAQITEDSTVMLFACGGVLTPVPLPPGTTLKRMGAELREEQGPDGTPMENDATAEERLRRRSASADPESSEARRSRAP